MSSVGNHTAVIHRECLLSRRDSDYAEANQYSENRRSDDQSIL
ncbi:hypothetical protein JCM19238_5339 [Vibrio ponticus]|nr:hypothetical protein JCM19238_5339 [Vibrio ponticus]